MKCRVSALVRTKLGRSYESRGDARIQSEHSRGALVPPKMLTWGPGNLFRNVPCLCPYAAMIGSSTLPMKPKGLKLSRKKKKKTFTDLALSINTNENTLYTIWKSNSIQSMELDLIVRLWHMDIASSMV